MAVREVEVVTAMLGPTWSAARERVAVAMLVQEEVPVRRQAARGVSATNMALTMALAVAAVGRLPL